MAAEVIHRTIYVLHAAAGVLSLPTGYVALSARKGSRLHRRSGMLFVCTMLTMSVLGAVLAIIRQKAPEVNVPLALLTFYFVVTALTAVRPIVGWTRRHDVALLCVVLVVALCDLGFGVAAVTHGGAWRDTPAFPFFLFGAVGLVAVNGDVRMLRTGPLRGGNRIARHLWRMSFALVIASLALGRVKVLPKEIRGPASMAMPLVVLVVMLWWLWRVRYRAWSWPRMARRVAA